MGTCFLYGNGGGSELNYKVVASASTPANPTANMIWIKSSTALKGHNFCSNTPSGSNSDTGYVYIVATTATITNVNSTTTPALNVIKKKANGSTCYVNLLLTKCMQVIGGTWTNVNAYLYKNSTWIQFSSEKDLVFDREIQTFATISANLNDVDPGYNALSDADPYVSFARTGGDAARAWQWKTAIDFSKYKTLEVACYAGSSAIVGIAASLKGVSYQTGVYETAKVSIGITEQVYSIDLSSISITGYIGFFVNITNKPLYVKSVYLIP